MKRANEYPRFCPNCGEPRYVQDTIIKTLYVASNGCEQEITSEATTQNIDYCTRCGLQWTSVPDPATALNRKLLDLSPNELISVIRFFYKSFNNLVKDVSETGGKSISHVQRVISGDRKSADVDQSIVSMFRQRLEKAGVIGKIL